MITKWKGVILMNYAYPTNQTFVTKHSLPANRSLSSQAIAIREYAHDHNFSINVNPITKEATITITEKDKNK